ncbi:hypothetical protein BASA61_008241 [Batrachochytrium salamandrivorans]|nr:hypothetical protein BASA61_008241 [Batrachochytrium salamandrivorans]
MQFFYLFSFVVVASYAAARPQPAGLSEKHSDNADATLASGLEARSYQPGLNSQRDSATLVSLERRGNRLRRISHFFDKAETGSLFLPFMIGEIREGFVDVPKNVLAAGKAVGRTDYWLVNYLNKSLYAANILKEWVEATEKSLVAVIKAGLDGKEYSKVEPLLKDASEKLAADASDNLQQVTAAVSAIGEKTSSAKPEVETIHAAFGRTFDAYKLYLATLQLQLVRFEAGRTLNRHLSVGVQSLAGFSLRQEELYDEIIEKLETAPSQ